MIDEGSEPASHDWDGPPVMVTKAQCQDIVGKISTGKDKPTMEECNDNESRSE